MGFNYGLEKKNFDRQWAIMRKQYEDAGMSIRTLCGVCLCSFVESKAFKIAIVPSADRSMDTCTVCQTRRGHDYIVMNR